MAFISTLGTAVGHPIDPSAVPLQVLHLSEEMQFKKNKKTVSGGKSNKNSIKTIEWL